MELKYKDGSVMKPRLTMNESHQRYLLYDNELRGPGKNNLPQRRRGGEERLDVVDLSDPNSDFFVKQKNSPTPALSTKGNQTIFPEVPKKMTTHAADPKLLTKRLVHIAQRQESYRKLNGGPIFGSDAVLTGQPPVLSNWGPTPISVPGLNNPAQLKFTMPIAGVDLPEVAEQLKFLKENENKPKVVRVPTRVYKYGSKELVSLSISKEDEFYRAIGKAPPDRNSKDEENSYTAKLTRNAKARILKLISDRKQKRAADYGKQVTDKPKDLPTGPIGTSMDMKQPPITLKLPPPGLKLPSVYTDNIISGNFKQLSSVNRNNLPSTTLKLPSIYLNNLASANLKSPMVNPNNYNRLPSKPKNPASENIKQIPTVKPMDFASANFKEFSPAKPMDFASKQFESVKPDNLASLNYKQLSQIKPVNHKQEFFPAKRNNMASENIKLPPLVLKSNDLASVNFKEFAPVKPTHKQLFPLRQSVLPASNFQNLPSTYPNNLRSENLKLPSIFPAGNPKTRIQVKAPPAASAVPKLPPINPRSQNQNKPAESIYTPKKPEVLRLPNILNQYHLDRMTEVEQFEKPRTEILIGAPTTRSTRNSPLIFNVRLNGKQATPAILDTALSFSLLTKRLADELGLSKYMVPQYSAMKVIYSLSPILDPIKYPKVLGSIHSVRVRPGLAIPIVMNFQVVQEAQCDCVLGVDFVRMSRAVVNLREETIIFDQGKTRVHFLSPSQVNVMGRRLARNDELTK